MLCLPRHCRILADVQLLVLITTPMLAQNMNLMVTALHCAAITGQFSCVELLIRAGADTRLRDGVSECSVERPVGEGRGFQGGILS